MRVGQDYKACVLLSLQVMQGQRRKLLKDSKEHYSTIYSGLHESGSDSTRNLYFEKYEMEWLDSHWNAFTALLKQRENNYTKKEQKEITVFFAEYFSKLMSELENASAAVKVAAQELIRSNQQAIKNMIMFSESWEERSNQLVVSSKKHKEHFKRLLENALNKSGD